MDSMPEKSPNKSKELLFGLLVNCIFSKITKKNCPLYEFRISLPIDKKYDYVMGLNEEEINNILTQHEKCYEQRMSDLIQD